MDQLCEQVNGDPDGDAVGLASYVLWRLNWIHPFAGGNGRTARAVSYLVLCDRLGFMLEGKPSLPEQLVANSDRYTQALRDADAAWLGGVPDVSRMIALIDELLKNQLSFLKKNRPPAQ